MSQKIKYSVTNVQTDLFPTYEDSLKSLEATWASRKQDALDDLKYVFEKVAKGEYEIETNS